MDPVKEYSCTKLSLDNCIIPNERLLNTPSAKDGCSHELEVDLRIVGCEYIQSAGLLLRLPQVAMATAQVLFQRFFYSKSFVKYSIQPLAMASIFLAAKIEENFRRLREVINVFHHLKQKRMGRPIVPMEYMGEEYFKMKSTVIKYERFLLKDLGFCVHVKHPHKLVVTYLQMLDLQKTPLVQKAWNNMNDSLRTNVFVRFTPETIACACIFLAVKQLKVPLPLRPPWWKVFGATQKDLEAISLEVLALYSRPRKFLDALEKEVSVLREKLAKKQVEIKEVKLKKIISPGTTSPIPSDQTLCPKEKVLSKSPLATTTLVGTKASSTNPSPLSQSLQPNKQLAPIKNGISKSPQSLEDNPRKRSRSRSLSAEDDRISTSDHSKSRSPREKPIISPIKLSSSGSEGDRPGSISPARLNGMPKRYRRDLESERPSKRHKHYRAADSNRRVEQRSSKHSRSKYKSSSRDSERQREHYRYERDEYYDDERDRDDYLSSKSRRNREKDRDYYSSSKVRKSESLRYR